MDKVITRSKLYEEIWKKPATHVASSYGISDVALSKICRKLQVPKPPRGYWARLQKGYKVTRTPLPKLQPGAPDEYLLGDHPKLEKRRFNHRTSHGALQSGRKKRIVVPERLRDPHPLIQRSREILEATKTDKYGVFRPHNKDSLDMRVGPKSLYRALRIMDALIKALEGRGFQVETKSDGLPVTKVLVRNVSVRFSLNEKIDQFENLQDKSESSRSYFFREKWGYSPTGRLMLIINEVRGADGRRKRWADTPSKSLEELLDNFFLGLIKIAYAKKQEDLNWEVRERQWEEHRRRQEQLALKSEREKERLSELENQAESWSKSMKLRAFIQEVINRASDGNQSVEFQERLNKWVSWANQHADRLDPLKGSSEDLFCPGE